MPQGAARKSCELRAQPVEISICVYAQRTGAHRQQSGGKCDPALRGGQKELAFLGTSQRGGRQRKLVQSHRDGKGQRIEPLLLFAIPLRTTAVRPIQRRLQTPHAPVRGSNPAPNHLLLAGGVYLTLT